MLVANAGIAHYLPFTEMPLELRRAADAASTGSAPLYTVQAALPRMLERGRGHIVIVSSGAGIRSFPRRGRLRRHQGRAARLRRGAAPRARRAPASGVTMVLPGQIRSSLHDAREGAHAGLVQARARGCRPSRSARRSSRPSRRTGASVFYPSNVRLLRIVHGAAPDAGRRACCAASWTGAPRREACRSRRPLKPQLAKSARELPDGDGWCYEPKWDGFRTIVFRDGDEVHLQSRNGKPMNRYFPEVVEQALALQARAAACSTARWS